MASPAHVGNAVGRFMPDNSPGWYVTAGCLLYFGVTYLLIRKLEREGIYLKL
jgi:hypothetical protein